MKRILLYVGDYDILKDCTIPFWESCVNYIVLNKNVFKNVFKLFI